MSEPYTCPLCGAAEGEQHRLRECWARVTAPDDLAQRVAALEAMLLPKHAPPASQALKVVLTQEGPVE